MRRKGTESDSRTTGNAFSSTAEAPAMELMPQPIGRSSGGAREHAEDLRHDLDWDDDMDQGLRPEEHSKDQPLSRMEKAIVLGQNGCCLFFCMAVLAAVLVPLLTAKMDPNIRTAVRSGDVATLREILDDNPKFSVDTADWDEKTALHWAVIKNHPHMVSFLLERRADVELESDAGHTALHYAAREGHTEILKILLGAGAHVNGTDHNHWTALHWAALYGNPGVAQQLIAADVDTFAEAQASSERDFHKTALDLAQSNGHMSLVHILDRAMQRAEESRRKANLKAQAEAEVDAETATSLHEPVKR